MINATEAHSATTWLKRLFQRKRKPATDSVCFFVPDKSRGWILEAACREITQRLDIPFVYEGNYKAIPEATAYYFCHYHFFLSALRINPWLAEKNCVVWFTHPKEENFGDRETILALNKSVVVTMCSRWKNFLVEKGLEESRVQTITGAADPNMFLPHDRGGGKVGFCSAYYERKMPDRILEIARSLPEYHFVLMGRKWDEYPRYAELIGLPNLEYREAAYKDYPNFYRELDVFVSVSQLEGGPIPLLESMMSNVVPVASDTGFAPDVIEHGKNGFLFPADEPEVSRISDLVRQAMKLNGDVRKTVLSYSWENYAEQHAKLFRSS
ncbi:glycosyltransferase family 4 protein [Pirellulaceae bacterium SH449]